MVLTRVKVSKIFLVTKIQPMACASFGSFFALCHRAIICHKHTYVNKKGGQDPFGERNINGYNTLRDFVPFPWLLAQRVTFQNGDIAPKTASPISLPVRSERPGKTFCEKKRGKRHASPNSGQSCEIFLARTSIARLRASRL